jgi:hypothetical protein
VPDYSKNAEVRRLPSLIFSISAQGGNIGRASSPLIKLRLPLTNGERSEHCLEISSYVVQKGLIIFILR